MKHTQKKMDGYMKMIDEKEKTKMYENDDTIQTVVTSIPNVTDRNTQLLNEAKDLIAENIKNMTEQS